MPFQPYRPFWSRLLSRINRNRARRPERQSRRRMKSTHANMLAQTEILETRQLLAADDLTALSDDFENAATLTDWQRIYQTEGWSSDQLETWDINQSQPGRMVLMPYTTVWYQDYRGPMVYKEITGDFVVTTQVHISDRDEIGDSDLDDVPNGSQYSLGGLMIRTPRDITNPEVDWSPGSHQNDGTNNGENYVFFSLGWGSSGNQFQTETKTTRNSSSTLVLQNRGDNSVINLQIARIGDSVYTLFQIPGEDWVLNNRYHRPDLPDTLQVGMVAYTDWTKANDYDPFYLNNNALHPGGYDPTPFEDFQPDLVAGFDFIQFDRPEIPPDLQGLDLRTQTTDQQLLSFLGGNVNAPDLPTVTVESSVLNVEELNSSQLEFIFSRSDAQLDQPLTVDYQISGTATPGLDFQSLSGEITFAAYEATVTLYVDVLDDTLDEPDETLVVQLLEGTGYLPGETTLASGTILDNDFTNVTPVASPLSDQTLFETELFALNVTPYFSDDNVVDGDQLTLSATLAGDGSLPDWLTFNPVTGTFNGAPVGGDAGSFDIEVTAADLAGEQASTTFQLTVSPLLQTQLDLRVVQSPTPVALNGETAVLPTHIENLNEWEAFQVEVWAHVSNASDTGIAAFAFDLSYNTAFTTATALEFGPAFTQNQTGLIDDASGLVQGIGGSTLITDAGDDQFVLLARIHFAPTADDQVSLDFESQSIGPADAGFALGQTMVDLVNQTPSQLESILVPPTQFWAVPYDVNDDDAINFKDLILFVAAYNTTPADSSLPYAWAMDFNQSGTVNFRDLILLAANYGLSKPSHPELIFDPGYPETWTTQNLVAAFSPQLNQQNVPPLSKTAATETANSVIQAYAASSASTEVQLLKETEIEIVDLPDNLLAQSSPGKIQIDATAAGQGWFIDATPGNHSEFSITTLTELQADAYSAAAFRIDLLTVIAHEFEHLLGHQHETTGLRKATLSPGTRRLPEAQLQKELQRRAQLQQETDQFFSSLSDESLLAFG
ncbi:Calx-beta domain protein [Gimesia panareensis]|nr:Calx-beta domain protein [Gimesia panareensis]